jgi:hypothetical protein
MKVRSQSTKARIALWLHVSIVAILPRRYRVPTARAWGSRFGLTGHARCHTYKRAQNSSINPTVHTRVNAEVNSATLPSLDVREGCRNPLAGMTAFLAASALLLLLPVFIAVYRRRKGNEAFNRLSLYLKQGVFRH